MSDKEVTEILEEVEEAGPTQDPSHITLSNGVRLRVKKVPPLALSNVERKFPLPPVPTVKSPSGKEVPWEDDPNWIRACQEVEARRSVAQIDILLALGTELEYVPDGMESVDSDGWAEALEEIGMDVRTSKAGRYLDWLKLYGISDKDDLGLISSAVVRLMGVSSEDVSDALDRFKS